MYLVDDTGGRRLMSKKEKEEFKKCMSLQKTFQMK